MPLSMSPTRTELLPPVIACASGVWIWAMSHCSGDKLSESLAGEFGKPPASGPFATRLSSRSLTPNPRVDAAASIRESLSTAVLKLGEFDRAITTPICG